MATIYPFRGIRYHRRFQENLGDLTAPPYDVIDITAQQLYYARHQANIIRLELPQAFPSDNEQDNRYTRAAAVFRRWLADQTLVRDPRPALYVYQQDFQAGNRVLQRTGFITCLRTEPYSAGTVLPHEETLPKHKADRLQLMQACEANFSSIFGLYADPDHTVDAPFLEIAASREPDLSCTDQDQTRHRLWLVDAPSTTDAVARAMAPLPVFIADGHHRYETAVQFAAEMAAMGKQGYDRVMITLVNLFDPGLVVFPTHRLVSNVPGLQAATLLASLEASFVIEKFPLGGGHPPAVLEHFLLTLATAGLESHCFGLYPGGDTFYLLKLKPEIDPQQLLDQSKSPAWRNLDVSILHGLIIEPLLGIDSQARANEANLTYTRDAREAFEAVRSGHQQLAFYLNATKVEEVTVVATAGDRMPQKSTFFYPKLLTGLVINPLGEGWDRQAT